MVREGSVTFRLGGNIKSALQELARQENRTLSNYIERVLADHIKNLPVERRQSVLTPAPLPPDLELIRNMRWETSQTEGERDANTPGDKLLAEALERMKDWNFTKEQAHRFMDEAARRFRTSAVDPAEVSVSVPDARHGSHRRRS